MRRPGSRTTSPDRISEAAGVTQSPARRRLADIDGIAAVVRVFHRHDRVGARRQHAAGGNAKRRPRFQRRTPRRTHANLSGDAQPSGRIGGANRESVHRRSRGCRNRRIGDCALCQHASEGALERNEFDLRFAQLHAREIERERLLRREERGGLKSNAA